MPVVRDLGRPRGREQLRRADAAGPGGRRRVPRPSGSPPTRRGGSTCRCASRSPVDGADTTIYRTGRYGDLVDLILLDGRQYRSDQACGDATLSVDPACPEALDPSRTMLGATQEAWVGRGASPRRRATWAVLGQQTVLTDLRLPNGAILNYDQWDGYAPARDRLLAAGRPVAERVVVLTGDIHLAGIGRLPGVGTEFVTTSISSSGLVPAASSRSSPASPTSSTPSCATAATSATPSPPPTGPPSTASSTTSPIPDSPVSTWHTFTVPAGASTEVTAA